MGQFFDYNDDHDDEMLCGSLLLHVGHVICLVGKIAGSRILNPCTASSMLVLLNLEESCCSGSLKPHSQGNLVA